MSRRKVTSPCINICVVHPETRLCTGCARSVDEIARWGSMSEDERLDVMVELPSREAAPKTRRGGRKGRMARNG